AVARNGTPLVRGVASVLHRGDYGHCVAGLLVWDCGQPDAIAISAGAAGRRRACQDVRDTAPTLGFRHGRPGMTEQNCETATSAAGRSSLSACRVSACRVMRPQTAWIREARVYLQVRITLPNCPGACWPVVAVQFLGNGWQPSFWPQ